MKKLTVLLLSVLMLFLFIGCEATPPVQPDDGAVTPTEPVQPNEPTTPETEEKPYTVTLVFPDGATIPSLENTYAVWTNKSGVYTAPFSQEGIASSNEPDGDYQVTVRGLPEGFSYDPNLYGASNDSKNVSVTIVALRQMAGSGGSSDNSCYQCSGIGVYRFPFNSSGEQLYFTFTPRTRGTYQIRSMIDATANETTVTIYKHASFFLNPQDYTEVDPSVSGTFTKNFKLSFNVAEDELGGARHYSILIQTSVAELSASYVDIAIEKLDDYVRPDTWEDAAVPVVKDFTLPTTGEFTLIADTNGKLLDQNMLGVTNKDGSFNGYLGEDGYFHVGSVTGPVLYAQLNQDLPFLLTDSGLGLCDGLVRKTCSNVGLDYTAFFAAHRQKMQGERGLVPVTPELKEFLYNFSVSNQYFWDGNGVAETAGYNSDENSQWLFACGYFL